MAQTWSQISESQVRRHTHTHTHTQSSELALLGDQGRVLTPDLVDLGLGEKDD